LDLQQKDPVEIGGRLRASAQAAFCFDFPSDFTYCTPVTSRVPGRGYMFPLTEKETEMSRNFREMLENKWGEGKFVCVGLDSEFDKIPESARTSGNECKVSISNTIVAFNEAIVEATRYLVCAYKPNFAFYAKYGDEGLSALHRTIMDIRAFAPDVPIILDIKDADIGNTNAGYVKMAFEYLRADAVTISPYLGREAVQPFLDCADKGIFVLCRTSNPGSNEFQGEDVAGDNVPGGYMPLYKYVAYRVARHWDKNNNCGLVVGANLPEELAEVREMVGDMPILIPAIGFQQKDVPLEQQVERAVSAGKDGRGKGMIINSSRGIIFASKGADFAEAARRETLKLHNLINQYR
jgi:orotidine-5'-phosphate decarboxylase